MTTSKTIVFFGNERLATAVSTDAPILRSLIEAGYKIAAVITPNQATIKHSRKSRLLEVSLIAQAANIPHLSLTSLKDSLPAIAKYKADVGILAAFGKIVPQSIIDLFPYGIVNIHPSLLPLHRGPIPIEAPILNGEPTTGVSLMQLVAAMDAGPIYDQVEIKLTGRETKPELAATLAQLGAQRLISVLPIIFNGQLKPRAQDENGASYDKKITAGDGSIDFTKPAIFLEREIRAYLGWPRSKTTINNQPLIITSAHVIAGKAKPGEIKLSDQQLVFGTSADMLAIDRLQPAGGREMRIAEYLRGKRFKF